MSPEPSKGDFTVLFQCSLGNLEEASMPTGETIADSELARLLWNLADAVIICDPAGDIVYWNPAATRVFGWTAAEARGGSLDVIEVKRGSSEGHPLH